MSDRPPILDYSKPDPHGKFDKPWPLATWPLVLVFPGTITWIIYFVGKILSSSSFGNTLLIIFWFCWLIAVVTAIASGVIYLPRFLFRYMSAPWYIWLNLSINMAGLAYGAILFVLNIFF
jgi:hypothetical protein